MSRSFHCVTLLINVFSADPLLVKSLVPLKKKQFLGSVLVFEQRTKHRQLNTQINNDLSVNLPENDTLFFALF